MFLLGFACGFVMAFAVLWLIADEPSERLPAPGPARRSIHEIERQAIREMVATAMVNGRIGKSQPNPSDEGQQSANRP